MSRIFAELKRRNVFRVAVAYVVASWLILQVADIVLQGIEAPAWVMKVFMLVLALGFPFALIFSWAYELTPEGLKREKDVDRSVSATPDTGRKLNLITIGMLVVVLAVVIIDRTLVPVREEEPADTGAARVADTSIAVLAFDDLSPEGDQAYFADGISEELLNVLAQVPELKVAGRTSSFAFKGTNTDLREIGELLNVAHILEGSVRKAGNRIRVTAQLIKADDGFHLFSEVYDRDLEDIFAVQEEIAQKISAALLTEIVGTEAMVKAETDPEAYELFLKARQRIHTRDLNNLREADAMLARVLELDPDYAPALAQKALVTVLLSDQFGAYGDIPIAAARPVAMRYVDRALAIEDSLPEANAVKGYIVGEVDPEAGIEYLEPARAMNPTDSNAANWLARLYPRVGRLRDSRQVLEEVVVRDPTYPPAFMNLVINYLQTSELDEAEALVRRVERIVGDNEHVDQARGSIDILRGEPARAARALARSYAQNPSSSAVKAAYGLALLGLADYDTLVVAGAESQRVLAYSALDYWEPAEAVLDGLDLESMLVVRALGEIALAMNYAGRSEACIGYVEANFGSVDKLVALHPTDGFWGAGYLGPLAWAYRQQGDETTASRLIDTMQRDLDNDVGMEDNWVRGLSVAQHAALAGDDDAALAALRKAIDDGLRSLLFFDDPIFSGLADRAEHQAMRKELVALVDEQRAIMGMVPYRPLRTEDEQPSFVN